MSSTSFLISQIMVEFTSYYFNNNIINSILLFRMDGLKSGPVLVGTCNNNENWLQVAKSAIEERIQKFLYLLISYLYCLNS